MTKLDRLVVMWLMVVTGVIMVCFATSIGNALYPPLEQPGGGYINRDLEILQAIVISRCLGFMIFSAGLAERLAIAISALSTVRPIAPVPSSKPRNAWSMPNKAVDESDTI